MGKGLLALAIVIAIVLLVGWLMARNAPTCRCGDEECGGGCLPRKRYPSQSKYD